MSELLYAAGDGANLMALANAVTLSPAEDTEFPAENIYDLRVSRVGRHGSNASDPSITVDLAFRDPFKGDAANISARSGQPRVVSVTGGTCAVSIYNPATKKYLTAAGAWQASSTNCLTTTGTVAYTVESFDTCKVPTVRLVMTVSNETGLATDWPQWNSVTAVGHNVDAGMVAKLRSSTDNFSGSNVEVATGTVGHPGFYIYTSTPQTSRYARLQFTGDNSDIPWYGEVIFAYLNAATPSPEIGYNIVYDEPEIRNQGRFGVTHVYTVGEHPIRTIKLTFGDEEAAHNEVRKEIVRRARGGAYPVLLVPADDEDTVIFGRLTSKWSETRRFSSYWDSDLILVEDPVATPLALD